MRGQPKLTPPTPARELEVHLFAAVLADVGDEEVARQPVEADAPRVAETPGPDLLLLGSAGAGERVVRRDRVVGRITFVVGHVDGETQELAQMGGELWPLPSGSPPPPPSPTGMYR